MPSSTVIIFGGTGFIGRSLAGHLAERGLTPILIARNPPSDVPHEFAAWDAVSVSDWVEALEGATA